MPVYHGSRHEGETPRRTQFTSRLADCYPIHEQSQDQNTARRYESPGIVVSHTDGCFSLGPKGERVKGKGVKGGGTLTDPLKSCSTRALVALSTRETEARTQACLASVPGPAEWATHSSIAPGIWRSGRRGGWRAANLAQSDVHPILIHMVSRQARRLSIGSGQIADTTAQKRCSPRLP